MDQKPNHFPVTRDEKLAREDVLVPDLRYRLTPAQLVEKKLVSLLKSAPLPISHLQTVRQRGPR
jgi:hypothetical protein